MENMIKVLVVKPFELPEESLIKNDLESFQKVVGGYIEYTPILNDEDVIIVCNEEGKVNNETLNRYIGYDIIAGPFFITRIDEEGNNISLTDKQIDKYKKVFDGDSITKTQKEILKILNKNSIEEREAR